MDTETLIYGLPAGETERYMEVLLSTKASTPEQIDAVKSAASRDGFHSFRLATFTPGEKPDFTKTLTRK